MAILDFDYNAALRQAGEIESVARDMKSLANQKLQNSIDAIRRGWTGDAANKFLVYCDEVKMQINSKADSLNSTAATIRNVARQLEEAEQRAKAELLLKAVKGGK